jgi:hypothetical protein
MLLPSPFYHIHLASLLSLPILHPSAPRLAAMAQPPTFFDGAHHFRMDRTTIYSIAGNYNVNVSNVQMDGKPSSKGLFSDCLLMQFIQILSVD